MFWFVVGVLFVVWLVVWGFVCLFSFFGGCFWFGWFGFVFTSSTFPTCYYWHTMIETVSSLAVALQQVFPVHYGVEPSSSGTQSQLSYWKVALPLCTRYPFSGHS